MTLRRLMAAVGMLALAGCPGRLDDPDSFKGCQLDVETDIFKATCATKGGGCHDAADMTNGLDLVSPGVKTRLMGMSSATCTPTPEPLATLIKSKISSTPSCGSRMPLGTALTDPQIKCVNDYLDALATGGDGGN